MTQEQISTILGLVVPILLFLVVIYFFIMKPEKKRRQQVFEMQSQLEKNNKIVTIGGIHGIVEDIKEDVVTIILVSGAKMKIEKAAIKRIISE
ncbi:preprotein translocase subunit YajC [Mycoplasmatota bacterium]|nr:preprotein translocase subunit YajC [Mycoplasmatota bacterium]